MVTMKVMVQTQMLDLDSASTSYANTVANSSLNVRTTAMCALRLEKPLVSTKAPRKLRSAMST